MLNIPKIVRIITTTSTTNSSTTTTILPSLVGLLRQPPPLLLIKIPPLLPRPPNSSISHSVLSYESFVPFLSFSLDYIELSKLLLLLLSGVLKPLAGSHRSLMRKPAVLNALVAEVHGSHQPHSQAMAQNEPGDISDFTNRLYPFVLYAFKFHG